MLSVWSSSWHYTIVRNRLLMLWLTTFIKNLSWFPFCMKDCGNCWKNYWTKREVSLVTRRQSCVSVEVVWLCSHPEQVFSCTTVSLFNWKKGFHSSLGFHSTPKHRMKLWYHSYIMASTGSSSVHECFWMVEQEESLSDAAYSSWSPPVATPLILFQFSPLFMFNPSPMLGIPGSPSGH